MKYPTSRKLQSNALAALLALASTGMATAVTRQKYVTILYATWHDYMLTRNGAIRSNGQPFYQPDGAPYSPTGVFNWWGRPAWAGGDLLQYRMMNNNNPASPNSGLIDNHAELLAAAGVDFITIDMSNGQIGRIMDGAEAVCRRYQQRSDLGLPFPRVAFFVNTIDCANAVKNRFYSGAYGDIFFKVDNKPLMLPKSNTTIPGFEGFTLRKMWGLLGAQAANQWTFKENNPINGSGAPGYKVAGWPEQRSVCAAAQQSYMTAPGAQGRQNGDYFNWNWKLVNRNNPTFVFVTAWNEWGSENVNTGADHATNPFFVDCYLTERSADLEPMKDGHGTEYYNRLKVRIAEYKRNIPNLAIRNADDGVWSFKYYHSGESLTGTNFTSSFNWAAGANYQSFVGDFNNDGYNDIGLRDTNTGTWYFAQRNPGSLTFSNNVNMSWGTGTHYSPLVADFNGDGLADIAMRNSTTGTWYIRIASSAYNYGSSTTVDWLAGTDYEPLAADFTGDGKADLALRQISTGVVRFAKQTSTPLNFYFSALTYNTPAGAGSRAFAGDFDLDGNGDIGVRNTASGAMAVSNGDGTLRSFSQRDTFIFAAGSSRSVHTFEGR